MYRFFIKKVHLIIKKSKIIKLKRIFFYFKMYSFSFFIPTKKVGEPTFLMHCFVLI